MAAEHCRDVHEEQDTGRGTKDLEHSSRTFDDDIDAGVPGAKEGVVR